MPVVKALCLLTAGVFPSKLTKAVASEGYVVISTNMARQLEGESNICKYTMMYQSNTTNLYYVYCCIRVLYFNSYRIILGPF